MSHDEKLYPLGAPVASLGDLLAIAHTGGWVWSQNAGKTILAADLLQMSGECLLTHFSMGMTVWLPPPDTRVSDAPKKREAGAESIMAGVMWKFAERVKRLENDVAALKKGRVE